MLLLQALGTGIEHGPEEVSDLFDWANYNARVFFGDDAPAQLRQSFMTLLSSCDEIELHESYAGMGTAGLALVHQFNAFKDFIAKDLSRGHGYTCIQVHPSLNFV